MALIAPGYQARKEAPMRQFEFTMALDLNALDAQVKTLDAVQEIPRCHGYEDLDGIMALLQRIQADAWRQLEAPHPANILRKEAR